MQAKRCSQPRIADLDVENKRLRVVPHGADVHWLHLPSGSARLTPRLIGDREAGPIFLANHRPAPAHTLGAVDLCPVTGRGRLAYERAECLFKQNSLKGSKGWTLHQLRHSAWPTSPKPSRP